MRKYLLESNQVGHEYWKICKKALIWHKSFAFSENFYDSLNKKFGYNLISSFDEKNKKIKLVHKGFGEILQSASTMGRCYFYALLLAKTVKNSKLVRGQLKNLDSTSQDDCVFEPFVHSWVEYFDERLGEVVLDTTAKQIFKKDYYYKKFNAVPDEIYNHEQLLDDELFFKLGAFSTNWYTDLDCLFVPIMYDYYKNNSEHCKKIIEKSIPKEESQKALLNCFENMKGLTIDNCYEQK